MSHYQSLRKSIRKCNKCHLGDNSNPVPPTGPVNSTIAVITAKTKLDSPLDLVTEQFLQFCGLESKMCYLSSLTMCPEGGDSTLCLKWKWLERQLVKPKLTILVGEQVTRAILKDMEFKDFSKVVGLITEGKWGTCLPIPAWEFVEEDGVKDWTATEWGIYATVVRTALMVRSDGGVK